MYKVGDEVLINAKIDKVDSESSLPYLIKLGSMGRIWTEEKELLDCKTYSDGLKDAWELVEKIYTLEPDEREKMLGYQSMKAILEDLSAEYVADKIEAYEKEKEIKPTDIVEYNGKNWVVTEVYKGEYSIWNGKKVIHTANVKKVGSAESIEPLAELLRQIGE